MIECKIIDHPHPLYEGLDLNYVSWILMYIIYIRYHWAVKKFGGCFFYTS